MKKNALMLSWIGILSFIGGFVNVYGIITIGLTLTHFTGDLSKSAMLISEHGDVNHLLKVVEGLLLFLLGNIIAGMIVGERNFNGKRRYGVTFLSIGLFLLLTYIFFLNTNIFSYVLCFTIGVQNGLFITYRGVLVRTSHITGSISDFGVHLGYKLRGVPFDNIKLYYYFVTTVFFFLGGFGSKILYDIYGKPSILIIPLLYFIVGGYYMRFRNDFEKIKGSVM